MQIHWTAPAWNDYLVWQGENPKMLPRINEIIRDIQRSPFSGIGKPEPLTGEWSGWWSRRIDEKHRLVYRVAGKRGIDQHMVIAKCRLHY